MSQLVDLERMHVYECGGATVYQMLCGRDLEGIMNNYVYLVVNTHERTAVAVDAAWDLDAIWRFADSLGVRLCGSLYTHGHPDHVGGHGVAGCKEVLGRGCDIWAGEHDAATIRKQCGLPDGALQELRDGDLVPLGDLALHVLHTPGHTPGSICILLSGPGMLTPREAPAVVEQQIRVPVRGGLLLSGDTMFVGGSGRTDLPESNYDHILESVLRLTELPPETLVLPGHHYDPLAYTTVDIEKGGNSTVMIAHDKRYRAAPLPLCCCCATACGPRGFRPGQRVQLLQDQGRAGDGSALASGLAVVEAWLEAEGGYAVWMLVDRGKTRRVLPADMLRPRGGSEAAAARASGVPVAYRVMHGTLLRKADPVSSGARASKVGSSQRVVGSLVQTTGRTWTGVQGTTWVELDTAYEKKGGWLALHGKCFGIDAELLRLEPSTGAQ